jgi:hypothetical protein
MGDIIVVAGDDIPEERRPKDVADISSTALVHDYFWSAVCHSSYILSLALVQVCSLGAHKRLNPEISCSMDVARVYDRDG